MEIKLEIKQFNLKNLWTTGKILSDWTQINIYNYRQDISICLWDSSGSSDAVKRRLTVFVFHCWTLEWRSSRIFFDLSLQRNFRCRKFCDEQERLGGGELVQVGVIVRLRPQLERRRPQRAGGSYFWLPLEAFHSNYERLSMMDKYNWMSKFQ